MVQGAAAPRCPGTLDRHVGYHIYPAYRTDRGEHMASAEIDSGICGFRTTVHTRWRAAR